MLTGVTLSPAAVAETLCRAWQACVPAFRAEGFAPFRAEYESLCANIGREVRVLSADGEPAFAGTAIGVDGDGALLVRVSPDEVKRCCVGEVSVRGLYGYV